MALGNLYLFITQIDKRALLKTIIIGIFIPNISLWALCSYLGFERTFINIDYFIPIILIPLLRFRLAGLILFLIFFVVFFIDILLIALQLFPFIKLVDILYLSNFIFLGPITYRFYLLILLTLLIFEYIFISWLAKKIKIKIWLVSFLFLLVLQVICGSIFYLFNINNNKGFSNPIISSNALFLIKYHNASFFALKKLNPLEPTKFQTASDPWFKKLAKGVSINNKLLLIVNESWGFPRNAEIQEATLAELKSNKNLFDYFEQGSFPFMGATVSGELRELCQLDPQVLNLGNIQTGFEHCLPNQLKSLGYNTVSLHANTAVMYERKHWYPLAGMNKIYFGDDIDLPKDSVSNTGIFDPNLLPFIRKIFDEDNKLFFYWMTYTTHNSYEEKDIRNKRFSCNSYNIGRNTEVCRSLMLQTQFFDSLAELVQKPEMQGVEVIVVGDHPPPILNFSEGIKFFDISQVSWIRFKIKDDIRGNSLDNH